MPRLPRSGLEPGRNVPTKFSRRELEALDDLVSVLAAKSRSAVIRVAVAYTLKTAESSRAVRDQLAELALLDGD
jgi:hypothetical protein